MTRTPPKKPYTPKPDFDPVANPTGQRIIDLYRDWYHPEEISEELDTPQEEIEDFLRNNRSLGKPKSLKPQDIEIMKKMYYDGANINEISNFLNISHITTRSYIKDLNLKKNIPVQDLHLANKRIQYISFLIQSGKLKKYYDKNYSFEKLAHVLKLTPPELRKTLQDARLEIPEN